MSLIDLMLALFITALGFLAVFSLVTNSASASRRAADQLIATNAARQEIEILRSMEAHLLANRTDAPFVGSVPQLNNLTNPLGTLSISDHPSLTGVKVVTVRITWTTRTVSRARSLSMSTLIGKDGLGT